MSETAAEVAELCNKYGERPVYFLDRLGILDADTLCAHGVWLEPGEIELLAQRQVGLSHTAESNMKLGAGVAPIPELLAARVKVGLGTDGCASNNNLDLFAEMDMVAKLHKVFRKDPLVCSAREVLGMATLGGARAMAWDSEIGSLEAGKKADLIAIDLNQPHLTPCYEPVSHLVYAASGSDVRFVWVAGQLVVANAELQTIDRPAHHPGSAAPGRQNQALDGIHVLFAVFLDHFVVYQFLHAHHTGFIHTRLWPDLGHYLKDKTLLVCSASDPSQPL